MPPFKSGVSLFAVLFTVCSFFTSSIRSDVLPKWANDFTADVFEQFTAMKSRNVVVSPLAMAQSLVLLSQAADGKTFEELRQGLHFDTANKTTMADQFLHSFNRIQSSFNSTNKILIKEGHQINEDFGIIANEKFNSKLYSKMPDDIAFESFPSNVKVAVISEIQLKSNFEMQFDADGSGEGEFYINGTTRVLVDFMSNSDVYSLAELTDLDARAFELKYQNSKASLVIILPNSRTGLPQLEEKLKSYKLTDVFNRLEPHIAFVGIPKFKVKYETELNDILKNMGINEMFTDSADWNGLLDLTGKPFKLSKITQKVSFEVDEGGSAASITEDKTAVKKVSKRFIRHIMAVHPFLYFIRDMESNGIILMGRIETIEKN